jgi:hypothetical protein
MKNQKKIFQALEVGIVTSIVALIFATALAQLPASNGSLDVNGMNERCDVVRVGPGANELEFIQCKAEFESGATGAYILKGFSN